MKLSKVGLALATSVLTAFVLVAGAKVGASNANVLEAFKLLQLDGGAVRWGIAAQHRSIALTYAFADTQFQFTAARNCKSLEPLDGLLQNSAVDQATFRQEAAAAVAMWERVADISFREVQSSASADILIGAQGEPYAHAFADVLYANGPRPVREIERSLICLNPDKKWKVGFDGNLSIYDLRYTLAHEIGHAIGLDHPLPSSQLMSMAYQERFRDLQPGDVSGVVQIYGARSAR